MKFSILFLALAMSSCGKVYDFELQKISELCGGNSQIKSIWVDASTVRANCKDGSRVSTKD